MRQWQRFSRILRHAYDHTAFYRERLEGADIEPRDIRTPEDLPRIPITTRRDLRDGRPLVADGTRLSRLKTSSSSGSTGERTVTYFDLTGWLLAKHLLKARARWACGARPWDRIAIFEQGESQPVGLRSRILRQRRFSIHRPCASILEDVIAFSPSIVYGFPSYLVRLAEVAERRLQPRLTFTSGEMLEERQRRLLTDGFGTEVLDIYGCTELKEIAWQCRQLSGYHINADWLMVEVVDPSGRPVDGEGSIVVTALYNWAMPLIRYEVGDTGRLQSETCDCGSGLPLMAPCLGRKDDHVRAADGTLVSPLSLMGIVRRVEGVGQYQVIQQADESVVVRIVPEGRPSADLEVEIREALQGLLQSVPVRIDFEESIAKEPSGKYRYVVSKRTGRIEVPTRSER